MKLRAVSTLAATAGTAVAVASCGATSTPTITPAGPLVVTPRTTVAIPPPHSRAHPTDPLDRQDRPTPRQRRAQHQRDRLMGGPLLAQLPSSSDGVHITVGGLAENGRRTILLLDGPSQQEALKVVGELLRRHHDTAARYELRFAPLLARLPVRERGVTMRDGGNIPDGRAVILVAGPDPKEALRTYERVLQRLHDPATDYLPTYFRQR